MRLANVSLARLLHVGNYFHFVISCQPLITFGVFRFYASTNLSIKELQ